MRKLIILLLISIILLQSATALQSHGTKFVFDIHDGAYTQDYRYIDYYVSPQYKIYKYQPQYYYDKEYYVKKRTVDWIIASHDWRYNANSGQPSRKAFGYNFPATENPNDFRNKPAYDYRDYYPYQKDNYYYKPQLTKEGYYNWNY